MTRRTLVLAVFATAFCGACSKPSQESAPASADGALGAPSPATSASAGPAAPTKAASARWAGQYTSSATTLYIPPDWKGVRWSVADSPAGLGDGAMALAIDPDTGRVSGSVDGPLGPATLDGFAGDGGVAGTLARKDPSDRGFTGTLVGSLDGDKLTGTMQMSAADANAVRKATFALSQPKTN
jgi:hypothetical protein